MEYKCTDVVTSRTFMLIIDASYYSIPPASVAQNE